MAIENKIDEEGHTLEVSMYDFNRGLDTRSSPINLSPSGLPDIQNMNLAGGFPSRMSGSILHATGMVMPDALAPTVQALYVPSSGAASSFILGGQDGQVYRWTGSAFVSLRRGLSAPPTDGWWSHTQLGDYLIISNRTDGNFKYDGTRLLPLGAKHIADFESGETWAGSGAVNTTTVRQGTQSRSLTSTGAVVTTTHTPATALDLIDGLLLALDYNTTTDTINFQVNLDVAANLDTTNSYIRFGNAGDTVYFQAAASTWGTLANGWNSIVIPRSSFTATGAPVWSNIAKVTLAVDATGANTVIAIFDDLYTIYAALMPAVQLNTQWKNMFVGGRSTADPSNIYYSKISAPDEYNAAATLPIDEDDGNSLTGIQGFFDQLVAAKDNTLHNLSVRTQGTTYPTYTFSTRRVTRAHGCSSHRSMVEANNAVYMFWQNALYAYSGVSTQRLSYIVDPTLADIEPTRLQQVVGAQLHAVNQIFWYWPAAGATTNTRGIRYDYQEGAFLPTVGTALAQATRVFESGVERLITAGYTGRILRQNSGTDFDGTAITAFVTFPWISGGRPDELKDWAEAYISYQTNTGNLIAEYRIANHPREFDAATFTTAGTIDMAVVGELGRMRIGERSRWMQLRLRTVGAPVTVYWPIIIRGALTGITY